MKRILLALLICVLIISGFPVYANALSLGYPFGGKITSSIMCTCPASFGWQITVGPPRPGVFMYSPILSRLFSYYKIMIPGSKVLGIASGYMPCMQISMTGCTPLSTGGLLIRLVGTSL